MTNQEIVRVAEAGRRSRASLWPAAAAVFALGAVAGWSFSNLGNAPLGEVAPSSSERGDLLATVDGSPITVADFEAEMARRGGAANFATAAGREALLDELVRLEVLAARARRAGYDAEHDVRADVKHLLAGRYRQSHLEPLLREVTVGDDEIEETYREQEQRFTMPAAVRVAVIHFAWSPNSSEEHRRRAHERAAAAREEALRQPGDEHFGAIAVHYSDDQASRYRGGEVGWVVEGQPDSRWAAPVMEAMFALAPGSLSEPIETDTGLVLVRVLETRPAEMQPLDEVAAAIRLEIQAAKIEQATQRFYSDAAQGLPIRVDEARLATIELPEAEVVDTERQPPALPQG